MANFGEVIGRAVRLFPGRTAVVQGETALTYGALEGRVQRAAALLAGAGVGRGDRVLMLFPNDFRFVEVLLGALRLGAIAVPANVKLGADTLGYIADHCDPAAIVAHAEMAEQAHRLTKSGRRCWLVGGEAPWAEPYDLRLDGVPAGLATVEVADSDPAMLMYTSGSTGRPKGCVLTHANKWWQARSTARTMLLDERDRALVMGPLYHANALWACLLPMLLTGGQVCVLPGFEAVAVLEAIDRYRPTFTSGTPSMYALMLAQGEALARCDLSSLRLLMCGSAPVSEELMRKIHEHFPCEVVETYGLTEGGANVLTPRWGIKKLGSTGLPVPDVEVRVASLDDPGRDCGAGEVGELWSRSPANAAGYFRQPEVTAERFTADGWLLTGDLVRRDEQGYIYFCGRRDDMINCGGSKLYPKEVETLLLAHPAVADACVVPAAHATKGEAPVAWVVLRDGAGPVEEMDLRRFCLARGPAYAHPRRVFFVERLPVTGTNKVDRRALREETLRRLPAGLASGS